MVMKNLPTATHDIDKNKHEIGEFGYTIIADALSTEQVTAMRERLIEQAICEARARGGDIDVEDEYTNGFVQSLLNKGAIWQDLFDPDHAVHQVLEHGMTPAFDPVMSQTQPLDQRYISFATGAKFKRKDRSRVGPEVSAERLKPDFHTDQKWAAGHLDYPVIITVFYMLSDFTYDNGCTLVVPGSHTIPSPAYGTVRPDLPPQPNGRPAWDRAMYSDLHPEITKDAVPVEGKAGTAFLFEGRLWHAGGINTNGDLRVHANNVFCAPYIRQRELHPMNLRQEVVDQLSERQLMMLGFDTAFQRDGDGLLGIIEPTLGRNNLTNKRPHIGELHDPSLVPV